MNQLDLMSSLSIKNNTKLLLLVMDGVGGLPNEEGLTTLEAAHTPNMDKLVCDSICGLSTPIKTGITAGSGPAHVGLFGYNPLDWQIGRGVLEALGIGFELGNNDIAARGNFCSIDVNSKNIIDRRAGRISTLECTRLVNKLKSIKIPNIEIFIEPVQDYRFVLVFRGNELHDGLTETDPQKIGVPSLPVYATHPNANETAKVINKWLDLANGILLDEFPANSCNLRGIAKVPPIPLMPDIYKMNLAAVASFPMYKGIAGLVGMKVLQTGIAIEEEFETLKNEWENYDFFFFHVKKTDSYGEDGNFDGKKKIIEETDKIIPLILSLKPDVLVITGDHSTPVKMKSHSWHEVPILLYSRFLNKDEVCSFGERSCMRGGLGHILHSDIMPLMMAHGLRLNKFGA